jgi:hypothetical protein
MALRLQPTALAQAMPLLDDMPVEPTVALPVPLKPLAIIWSTPLALVCVSSLPPFGFDKSATESNARVKTNVPTIKRRQLSWRNAASSARPAAPCQAKRGAGGAGKTAVGDGGLTTEGWGTNDCA